MFGEILAKNPVAYITRDLERALSIPPTKGFFIMTNTTPFGKRQKENRQDIHEITSTTLLDTHELLAHPGVQTLLNTNSIHHIMVFKPTGAIERLAKELGLTIINPSSSLASSIEEKITQLSFLEELRDIFLPFTITTLKHVLFEGTPFVVQFNHSHTGSGTKYIDRRETLETLQQQFPDRPVRVAPFIDGPLFTNNNVVTKETILVGNISYQITGLPPFTENRFATIGNDWALPYAILPSAQKEIYETIATRVGEALKRRGWKGLFGIDVLFDTRAGKLWLLEINARQPASATFESLLQEKAGSGTTTIMAHLSALLEESVCGPLQAISTGGQITQKVTPATRSKKQENLVQKLEEDMYTVTPYMNTEYEQDWIRIQDSKHSFMDKHGVLNSRGLDIQKLLA